MDIYLNSATQISPIFERGQTGCQFRRETSTGASAMYKLLSHRSTSSTPTCPGVCCAAGPNDSNNLNFCNPAMPNPCLSGPSSHSQSWRIPQVHIVAVSLLSGSLGTTTHGKLKNTLPSTTSGEPSLFARRPAHANRAHALIPYGHRSHPRPLGTAPDRLLVPLLLAG